MMDSTTEQEEMKKVDAVSLESDNSLLSPASKLELLAFRRGESKQKEASPEKETFFVEKILKKRITEGRPKYWVKWQGYDNSHNTWEPPGSFSAEFLAAYEEDLKAQRDATKKTKPDTNGRKTKKQKVQSASTGSVGGSKKIRGATSDKLPQLSADDVAQLESMTLEIPFDSIPCLPTIASDTTENTTNTAAPNKRKAKGMMGKIVPVIKKRRRRQSDFDGTSVDAPSTSNRTVGHGRRGRRSKKALLDDATAASTLIVKKRKTKKPEVEKRLLHVKGTALSPSKMDLLLSGKLINPHKCKPRRDGTEMGMFDQSNLEDGPPVASDGLDDSQNAFDWPSWNPAQTVSEFTLVTDDGMDVMFEEVRLLHPGRKQVGKK
ncbi:hypothetical protein BV898_05731 [Hypsibius exemplaris]|uniref:Chromo domain-containing protein n=1 Tax=Hypsibius exemplaris TaxID=2072580 RepID=A0A1W0WYB3_HYPEX|nr:hypothetical protein BV898_05731 [Hypsibius exemplaris]